MASAFETANGIDTRGVDACMSAKETLVNVCATVQITEERTKCQPSPSPPLAVRMTGLGMCVITVSLTVLVIRILYMITINFAMFE